MNKKGAGLRPSVMNLVLVVLFTFFIFTFVGLILQEQNPGSEVLNEKYRLNDSINSMQGVVDDFAATSDDVFGQMGSSEPTAVDFIFLIFKGAFYIPLAFLAFIFSGITALTSVIFPTLTGTGLGTIVSITLGVLFSSVIITIVLLIIKAIRTGESER